MANGYQHTMSTWLLMKCTNKSLRVFQRHVVSFIYHSDMKKLLELCWRYFSNYCLFLLHRTDWKSPAAAVVPSTEKVSIPQGFVAAFVIILLNFTPQHAWYMSFKWAYLNIYANVNWISFPLLGNDSFLMCAIWFNRGLPTKTRSLNEDLRGFSNPDQEQKTLFCMDLKRRSYPTWGRPK